MWRRRQATILALKKRDMSVEYTEIQKRGRTLSLPSFRIGARTIVCSGGWLKIASIVDEEWNESDGAEEPEVIITNVKQSPLKPDVFTFAQRFYEPQPKYSYYFEWDNAAAIRTRSFGEWWERLPQESRKNVRRAKRLGVVVKEVHFDDALVHGITGIYNGDPVRQTRLFWHYGKSFE